MTASNGEKIHWAHWCPEQDDTSDQAKEKSEENQHINNNTDYNQH